MSSTSEPPRLQIEVVPSRCQAKCSEQFQNGDAERPLLLKLCFNKAAKDECALKTGTVPDDVYVCTNLRCGALFTALQSLSPLQEIVK